MFKIGNFKALEEQINDIVNLNALITVLQKKGLLTSEEFLEAKKQSIEQFKKEYPELFEKEK